MTGLLNIQRGTRHVIILIALSLVIFRATSATAEETGITCSAFLKFSAGVIVAFAIHEGAHEVAAELTDTEMDWGIGNYNQPLGFTETAKNDSRGTAVYSAGLLSQAIGSEIILQVDSIDKNDAFVRGMMAWNIVNPISYAADYWFIHRTNKKNGSSYQGDLQGIEHYQDESTAQIFAASLVAIAAFQGYRFVKTQSWAPEWIKDESHRVDLKPLSSGGLAMTYNYRF